MFNMFSVGLILCSGGSSFLLSSSISCCSCLAFGDSFFCSFVCLMCCLFGIILQCSYSSTYSRFGGIFLVVFFKLLLLFCCCWPFTPDWRNTRSLLCVHIQCLFYLIFLEALFVLLCLLALLNIIVVIL